MSLKDAVTKLPQIGNHYGQALRRANINSIEDLFFYLPYRYLDFSENKLIGETKIGEMVTIKGQIGTIQNIYTRSRKTIQSTWVSDKTGSLKIIWFNQPYLSRSLKEKDTYAFAGEIKIFQGQKVMIAPEYEKTKKGKDTLHTGRLVPLYSHIPGLSSKWLRERIQAAFKIYRNQIKDSLPSTTLKKINYPTLKEAFGLIHFPNNKEGIERGRQRLALEEFLRLQLTSLIKKSTWQKGKKAPPLKVEIQNLNRFINSLPFQLTNSQKRSLKEILTDMQKDKPMNRLLEGDVGSGKTILAIIASLVCFQNKKKSVIMAPTEILAKQHFLTFNRFLRNQGAKISFLTANEKVNLKNPDIIIGTHALIYKSVNLKDTGLVVIDEQHKFGVEQRATLIKESKKGGLHPHLLTMTATPIPRTIALTAYGNLDLSTIDELPLERKKTITWLVPEIKREGAYNWIKEKIKNDKSQVFIVCPLIEDSLKETMQQVKAVESEYQKLIQIFQGFKVALLHGKLKNQEKNEIIEDFKKGAVNILVATPVIEVGIDIPNADIILIETAERFGLAQLHQLRGRVGRGGQKGYCLLFTSSQSFKTRQRLQALKREYSGFRLAEIDLKLRGPGEIWGTKQHGFPKLRAASWSDLEIIKAAREIASEAFKKRKKYAKLWETILPNLV